MDDTIMALATPSGAGAIAIIRMSGKDAFAITDNIFRAKGKKTIAEAASHTIIFGDILDPSAGSGQVPEIVDEVLVSVFRNPKSFTGEDSVEISCHGSTFIQKRILNLLSKNGCRMAKPGEYSMRAFLNRKMDLSQAEAVADLIASSSEAAHQVAMHQMRGGFGNDLRVLREELVHFASLIELELDFSEEDVEFADRSQLAQLINRIIIKIEQLIGSFELGNVIKEGVQVAIIGEPNAGKSTLLNALLNEERAIVSDIAGTTRDTVEDELVIEGIRYRFIDTAGIRQTSDTIESLGIERTMQKAEQADVVMFLFDASTYTPERLHSEINELKTRKSDLEERLILVANKTDKTSESVAQKFVDFNTASISAKEKTGIEELKLRLTEFVNLSALKEDQTIVTNTRHIEALNGAKNSLQDVLAGFQNQVPGDLVAIDIRRSLFYLGAITGEITTDDLLGNIFSKFCIGK
ncbi:MAG: tRNA uridine-5-carboxymethylaminomethyl(34) synthesis GTPase MnmE [Flavobacteriales bacterium]|nr:tRNA uridine-5-carboxymethylaminomethyl(34) synthesis GTPase MnmE [Flavobacteriales bacterium]